MVTNRSPFFNNTKMKKPPSMLGGFVVFRLFMKKYENEKRFLDEWASNGKW